ncbi:acyl carrier protein [Pseudodesulfovibrio sp. zrk46]|uniref:acyl carrier protein n=1 Tax=Pseudodesulfovibrio sp. zrk46 TaxID=2725288 RepID=UPI0014495642|nr:acyl carrier protein [Pseudodesulfovibrio sp. zrk46]QJB56588.1 acyl carrier protein [Pseudodesulfovibrio sp. zrk46]
MSNDILNKVTEIVRGILAQDDLVLTPETVVKEVERWDSLMNINIVMALEAEFNFRFDLGELDSLQTVGDILSTIESKTN